MTPSPEHEHNWEFQGVVYWHSNYPMPGSGAHYRHYGDRYFCTRCLEIKTINQRDIGNSYEKPLAGAMPS